MDTSATRAELGRYGEQLACRYLCDHGFTILERNWRCARGEIDIIAREAATLVVCEVKTRTSERFGAPFEAVTRHKLRRLRRLAILWLQTQARTEHMGTPLRIDIVSILRPESGAARITHLRGVS